MSLDLSRVTKRVSLITMPAVLLATSHLSAATATAPPAFHFVHARPVLTTSPGRILVANEGDNTGGSILEFPETANGNVAPAAFLSGGAFSTPFGVAVDSSGRLGVTLGNTGPEGNHGAETFAPGAIGDATPLTVISCFPRNTQTDSVAFDSAGNLYVATRTAIEIFAPGANNCPKPLRVISDAGGIAIDKNDVLYVASPTGSIDIFAPGASTPKAHIAGSNTGLIEPAAVALDAAHNVYVLDFGAQALSEFAAGAHGNVTPVRTIAGANTGLSSAEPPASAFPDGIAVSHLTGEIFVANPTTNAILGFAPNANGNAAPVQVISGSATKLSVPLRLTLQE